MKNLTIKEAKKEDLPIILRLYSYLDLEDSDPILPQEKAASIFNRIASYPFYHIYLAFLDDEPVGTFSILVMDNLGHGGRPIAILENIVVEEAFRGKGIGTVMVHYAMNVAKEKGCYKIMFSSNRNRHRAHKFYERLGFKIHGYSYEIEEIGDVPKFTGTSGSSDLP
ncbi:MAG: GNAT family N-acetyltransferase [Syntrophobacterales bacterium]|nr:GNAT family N-acetyltransferase [Syntrophobacterales bacterium]